MELKPYIVYTKSLVGHKVFASSEEDAIRAFENGEEVDSFEDSDTNEIDGVIEY